MKKSLRAVPLPSVERLRECFWYVEATGILYHRDRPEWRTASRNRYANKPAGHTNTRGYIQIWLDGRLYLAHRVIWKMMTGEEPDINLDHRDGNPTNNRMGNLREATHAENCQNNGGRRNKRSGLPLGVFPMRKGFQAKLIHDGKRVTIGTFRTPEEAHAAYISTSSALRGDFARHRRTA